MTISPISWQRTASPLLPRCMKASRCCCASMPILWRIPWATLPTIWRILKSMTICVAALSGTLWTRRCTARRRTARTCGFTARILKKKSRGTGIRYQTPRPLPGPIPIFAPTGLSVRTARCILSITRCKRYMPRCRPWL